MTSQEKHINNFARTKIQFLVSGPEVELTKIILGTPFLGAHEIQIFVNLTSCKLSGNFFTETGRNRVNLYTKYKEKNFLLTTNITQISPGYNNVEFKTDKLILENLSTQVSCENKNALEFPTFVNLKPNSYVRYKQNGWVFLKSNKCFELPINSSSNTPLGKRKLIIRLNKIEPEIEVSNCEIDKIVHIKDDQINVLSLQTETKKGITAKYETERDNWCSLVHEGASVISHMTVSNTGNLEYVSESGRQAAAAKVQLAMSEK